jgi:hypothetical protein
MIELGNEFPFSDEDEIKILNDEPILEGGFGKSKKKGKGKKPKNTLTKVEALTVKVSKKVTKKEIKAAKQQQQKKQVNDVVEKFGIDTKKLSELGESSKIEDSSQRRKQMRELIEANVSKEYDSSDKIDEAITKTLPPKLLKSMPGFQKLDLAQKQKILSHYLRDVSDTKSFDGDTKKIAEHTKLIYNQNIKTKKFADMIPAKQADVADAASKSLSTAAKNITKGTNKSGNGTSSKNPVGNAINKRGNNISFKEKKTKMVDTLKTHKQEYDKTTQDFVFVKNLSIDDIKKEQILKNAELKKLEERLNTADENKSKNIAEKIKKINDTLNNDGDKITKFENLKTEMRASDYDGLMKQLEANKKKQNKQLTTDKKKLKEYDLANPDKGTRFKQEIRKFKKSLLTGDIDKIDTDIRQNIENKEQKIKEFETDKGKHGEKIKLLRKQITVEKRKLDILEQKQTDTTKSILTKTLQEQGFSKTEIEKAIKDTSTTSKDIDLEKSIQEKMSDLTSRINKEITSPGFKIDVNTDKIGELRSELKKTVGKIEQSKLRKQISDLETANKKLEQRKSIMNNSVNSGLKRKDNSKLVANIDKQLGAVDKNLQFFRKEIYGYKSNGKKINGLINKPPNSLKPGNEAKIERYKQFQQNKARLELRKSKLQQNIINKTFAKGVPQTKTTKDSIKGELPSVKKMGAQDFEIFKTAMDGKLNTPEKKKAFQTRINAFKDALGKGSNAIAKRQAQFIKDQYGIDVKQFKLDNLSKMGEFFKNNVAKFNETTQKQLELQLLITETQEGGNLLKRLHPKKKNSKKAYQFSKSKKRTKKQLI